MSMKGKTLLKGHTLLGEGRPIETCFRGIGKGKAYCSCGQLSPVLECTAARKRWHKEHKQAIRKHMSAESEVL